MIYLTRFDSSTFALNPHLIETVECTPDTVITLSNGKKILVKNTIENVVELFIEYQKKIHSHNLVEKG